MKILVLSDLHLGKGPFLANGQRNILEDFEKDESFAELLEFYSQNEYYKEEVHLVFNGDILNLIQMDYKGAITHILTEDMIVETTQQIIKGHPRFFEALRIFLRKPNKKLFYVIGNHDQPIVFEKAQNILKEELQFDILFANSYAHGDVYIEHGHQFEGHNSVPDEGELIEFRGKKIVNLPWGSLFCLYLMPRLKKERPYIDKVRPLSQYIRWCLVHDTRFFIRLIGIVARYIIQTQKKSYLDSNKNFKTTWSLLKSISIYPRYDKNAKKVFEKNPNMNVIVLGHTHIAQWRRFPENKIYLNSGTWNTVPTMNVGLHQDIAKQSYVLIDINDKNEKAQNAKLLEWRGNWKPYEEDVQLVL